MIHECILCNQCSFDEIELVYSSPEDYTKIKIDDTGRKYIVLHHSNNITYITKPRLDNNSMLYLIDSTIFSQYNTEEIYNNNSYYVCDSHMFLVYKSLMYLRKMIKYCKYFVHRVSYMIFSLLHYFPKDIITVILKIIYLNSLEEYDL